jgi:CRP-like cAMP-binding protein
MAANALFESPPTHVPTSFPRGERIRRYPRDAIIALPADAILDVREGVVAQTVLHDDGSEVLLGLCGPGSLLVGHPEDDCCLQILAHTDVTVSIERWETAAGQPGFAARLRTRLRQMEAWSAMGARHYLDQRLLGILGLLAEQFGTPHDEGTLVDVRITHAQLAAAIGATRTTVTRLLGDLRARDLLTTSGTGPRERFCLRGAAGKQCHH